jgi:hypothetical protein
MRDSPDYVPATWNSWSPLLRWLAKKPSRVVWYFCVGAVILLGILAYAASTGDLPWIVLGAACSLWLAVEAVIYVPRALREKRRLDPN